MKTEKNKLFAKSILIIVVFVLSLYSYNSIQKKDVNIVEVVKCPSNVIPPTEDERSRIICGDNMIIITLKKNKHKTLFCISKGEETEWCQS